MSKPIDEIKKELKKEQPKKPIQFTFVPKKAIEEQAKRLRMKKE